MLRHGSRRPPAAERSGAALQIQRHQQHARLLPRQQGDGGLVLGVANEDIDNLASCAASWVQTNVRPYHPDVNIAVGNEVDAPAAAQTILPAMRNLQAALAAAALDGDIKVSTCVRLDVVTNTFPPSSGVFAQPYMADIARFLAAAGAPLLANVYPYLAYRGSNQGDVSLSYALFQPGTTVRAGGSGLVYTKGAFGWLAGLSPAGRLTHINTIHVQTEQYFSLTTISRNSIFQSCRTGP